MQTAELDDSAREFQADSALLESAARELTDDGFVVIPGFVADDRLSRLSAAYDRVIGSAIQSTPSGERAFSGSNIRVSNLLNRDPEFDDLFFSPLILQACSIVNSRRRRATRFLLSIHSSPLPRSPRAGWIAVGGATLGGAAARRWRV